jgi:hypothetical protein
MKRGLGSCRGVLDEPTHDIVFSGENARVLFLLHLIRLVATKKEKPASFKARRSHVHNTEYPEKMDEGPISWTRRI